MTECSSCTADCTPLLFNAAKDGNIERIKMVVSGMSEHEIKQTLNDPLGTGHTPLIIASRNGHSKCVEYLLSIGADPTYMEQSVSMVTLYPVTPLRGACYDGHLEIVRFLVTNGANIETPNRHGHTPLMISCYRSKVELVKYLILLGVDVNARGVKGNTALHDAAEVGNKEIVEMLLKAGARSQPGEFGVTPLMSAAMLGHTEVMPLLFCLASRKEKQDSWKLLGATLVDRKMDLASAISCWNNSFMEVICGPKGEKEGSEETESVALFDAVKCRVYVGDPEAIRMQALIVRERILGKPILKLIITCATEEPFIWTTEDGIGHTNSFLEAFSSILDDMRLRPERQQFNGGLLGISLEQVVVVLDRTVYEAERYLRMELDDCFVDYDSRDIRQDTENLLGVILQFLHLTNRIHALELQHQGQEPACDIVVNQLAPDSPASPYRSSPSSSSASPSYPSIPETSKTNFERVESSKNHYMLTYNDETGTFRHQRSPSRFVVEKLIEAGSDPKKVDSQGNTALHILLTNSINRPSLVKLLLDAGAPLLARNHKSVGGYTCLELIQKFSPTLVQELRIARWLTLKQMAANSVVRHWKDQTILDEMLPTELKEYIEVF
uniref:Protein fem-1 homolog B n=1 Tax=Ditylenchus dipsaci TaxID=166011 RepID=A0A915CVU3_9BILA